MKDISETLPWAWMAASLASRGETGEVGSGGPVSLAVGTSTGLVGSASGAGLSLEAGTGSGLESEALVEEAAPAVVLDFVEPAGDAAREVMERAWEFLMSVEPWACASEACAGTASRLLRTEIGSLAVLPPLG